MEKLNKPRRHLEPFLRSNDQTYIEDVVFYQFGDIEADIDWEIIHSFGGYDRCKEERNYG